MFLTLLTAVAAISAHANSIDAVKMPSVKTAASCAEMKQNIIDNLDVPTNGGVQQSAKFSILNLRAKAYSDVCGVMDQDLADKIFQSM